MDNQDQMRRLRWACRRGMLEVDLVLTEFLNQGYQGLDASDKALFEELLLLPDPLLFAWFMGSEAPEAARMVALVNRIRQHNTV